MEILKWFRSTLLSFQVRITFVVFFRWKENSWWPKIALFFFYRTFALTKCFWEAPRDWIKHFYAITQRSSFFKRITSERCLGVVTALTLQNEKGEKETNYQLRNEIGVFRGTFNDTTSRSVNLSDFSFSPAQTQLSRPVSFYPEIALHCTTSYRGVVTLVGPC